jgi:two-component system sensor histidine kinase KdpD
VFGLPLLTLLLENLRGTLSLESQVLLYLLAVVSVAVVGGIAVALTSAVFATFLINYYFVKPVHTLHVAQAEQMLALGVFLVVAAVVSGAVELAARRARAAERARDEAETLATLAGGELDQTDTLREVLERARSTFGMESVALKSRDHQTGEWQEVVQVGWAPSGEEAPLRFDVAIGRDLRMIGRGPALFAEDQRVLHAFSSAAQAAYAGRRLSAKAAEARELEAADLQRTSLLAAVGHDLRTPLAGIKASVSTLRQTDVSWSAEARDELLATIEDSADRLDSIVGNLLDASRLQAGALSVQAEPVALDEVIGAAVLAVPEAAGRVTIDIPEDLPLVQADPGLLERVLANLLDNAIRHSGDTGAVEVSATAGETTAKLKVTDHGPGVPAGERDRLFEPFQRLDDRGNSKGLGLGLAVARGFVEAMDGILIADSSTGGGLTMRLRLPLAKPPAAT